MSDFGLFESIHTDQSQHRIASRKAIALAEIRVNEKLGEWLKTNIPSEYDARLRYAKDQFDSIIKEACDETGCSESNVVISALENHWRPAERPKEVATRMASKVAINEDIYGNEDVYGDFGELIHTSGWQEGQPCEHCQNEGGWWGRDHEEPHEGPRWYNCPNCHGYSRKDQGRPEQPLPALTDEELEDERREQKRREQMLQDRERYFGSTKTAEGYHDEIGPGHEEYEDPEDVGVDDALLQHDPEMLHIKQQLSEINPQLTQSLIESGASPETWKSVFRDLTGQGAGPQPQDGQAQQAAEHDFQQAEPQLPEGDDAQRQGANRFLADKDKKYNPAKQESPNEEGGDSVLNKLEPNGDEDEDDSKESKVAIVGWEGSGEQSRFGPDEPDDAPAKGGAAFGENWSQGGAETHPEYNYGQRPGDNDDQRAYDHYQQTGEPGRLSDDPRGMLECPACRGEGAEHIRSNPQAKDNPDGLDGLRDHLGNAFNMDKYAKTANKFIEKRGDKWVVIKHSDGSVISTHDSEQQAEDSFQAMMMHKHGASDGAQDNTNLNGPSPKMNKRKWTPNAVGKDEIKNLGDTKEHDVTDPNKATNESELTENGKAKNEKLPTATNDNDAGFAKGGEEKGDKTKTFPKGKQADPVTEPTISSFLTSKLVPRNSSDIGDPDWLRNGPSDDPEGPENDYDCPECHGTGKMSYGKCDVCNGTGESETSRDEREKDDYYDNRSDDARGT